MTLRESLEAGSVPQLCGHACVSSGCAALGGSIAAEECPSGNSSTECTKGPEGSNDAIFGGQRRPGGRLGSQASL